MAVYTGVADANGDFNIPFSSNYTGGQKVTVTAEKDAATKTIELFAPSGVTGGGFMQYSGNLTNFPQNIGGLTLSSEIAGALPDNCFNGGTVDHNMYRWATGLTIPATITGLGAYCFANWTRATNLTLPSSINTIPFGAFDGWGKAISLNIPNNVTSVGDYGFRSWADATSITLSTSLTTIGQYAFLGWSKCTSLTIPNSVTTIGANAFQNWVLATTLVLSNATVVIPTFCFAGWSKCTSLTIPNSVTTIGANAFQGWALCTFVHIGTGVTTIGANAFQGLSSCDNFECMPSTPPTITSNTLSGLKSTCVIKVPAASLTAYQTATNWSAHASKMVGV